jgi:tetratricopeptide (TPR) repeat protein
MPAEALAAQRAAIEAEYARRRRQQGLDLLGEGARLLAQNRPGEAAARLEQAAALLPDDPDVAINLGGAYVLQKRYNKAVAVLEQASLAAPDNAMVWTNLAAAYLGSLELSGPQQQRKAIEAYERALQADPAAPNVHYNLGLIYYDRQDHALARHWFTRALEVNPDDRDARQWLARLARAGDAGDDQPPPAAGDDDMRAQPGAG